MMLVAGGGGEGKGCESWWKMVMVVARDDLTGDDEARRGKGVAAFIYFSNSTHKINKYNDK